MEILLAFFWGKKGEVRKESILDRWGPFLFLGTVWGRKKEGLFFVTPLFYCENLVPKAGLEPA